MATTIYVRSTDGSPTDDGSTWALAKDTLANAAAIDEAGASIYVSQSHNESNASAQTIALAGTYSSPVRIICGNDGAATPTTADTTAIVSTTTSYAISVTGCGYIYGISFKPTTSAGSYSGATVTLGSDQGFITAENCSFQMGSTSNTPRVIMGSASASSSVESGVVLKNCTFKFGATGQGLYVQNANLVIDGGSILSGGSTITTFIATASLLYSNIKVQNFDLTNASTNLYLVATAVPGAGRMDFINCKMPTSWPGTGGLVAGAPIHPHFRASMYGCSTGAVVYKLWIETAAGAIKDETTNIKTGGATDGTTPISWSMTSIAACNNTLNPLISDDIAVWNESTGSAKTISVDIAYDSATALTDAQVWLEIGYHGTASYTLGVSGSDKIATPLTTAAEQTTSTATWPAISAALTGTITAATNSTTVTGSGTSFTTELHANTDIYTTSGTWLGKVASIESNTSLTLTANSAAVASGVAYKRTTKQKLEVTFTPQQKGFIYARVCIGVASKTIYVDPLVTIS